GLDQGSVSQSFKCEFDRVDEDGNVVDADNEERVIYVQTMGRIVGEISLLPSSRVSKNRSNSYIYDFGEVIEDEDLTGRTIVRLKGDSQADTNLRIGDVSPEGTLSATLESFKSTETSKLYTLNFQLTRGEEPVNKPGKDEDDYGWVWIESDNPIVPAMKLLVRFELPAE
ncbi:MAG: hypothetical protein AAGA03_06495, partial [Planctomycetota bacterium]